jgi:hypothetical protein
MTAVNEVYDTDGNVAWREDVPAAADDPTARLVALEDEVRGMQERAAAAAVTNADAVKVRDAITGAPTGR